MQKLKGKRRWWTILIKFFLIIIILFILACFAFDHFIQFRMSDEKLLDFFKKNQINGRIHYYNVGGRKIRYISIGNDSLPTLFFIHGSPSSLSIYQKYYQDTFLLHHFKTYAVDRPGYGYSGFGNPEPSIKKQSEMIRPILDSLNKVKRPVIIMAGSYGTSIACRLTMDHPELVNGLVLVAPSLSAGAEHVYWFSHIIEHPVINWIIPRMFQSANTEKLAHKKELSAMLPYWKNIRIPVIYLQGENDKLIDTSNASFARIHLINCPYLEIHFFKNRSHFIPFKEHNAIRQKILEMYDRVGGANSK